jgi:crossover junction endodeoxyribonuclease RusA
MTAHQEAFLPADVTPRPEADELLVTVHGTPVGQGSMTRNQHGALYSDNKRLRPWRVELKHAIDLALQGQPMPLHGRGVPVQLQVTFTFKRPGSHFGTGRNAGRLRDLAPWHFTGTPDLDKCARAVGDALVEGGALADDSQIVSLVAAKAYPGGHVDALAIPGAVIRLRALP